MTIRRIKWAAIASIVLGTSFANQCQAFEFNDLDTKEQDFVRDYVVGTSTFTLLHEVGHMLVDQYELPVLGREEDAVDLLAAIIMLESGTASMDKALAYSSHEWMISSRREARPMKEQYAGVHSLSAQRAYSIACMMLGKDSEKFHSFARTIDYPERSIENCGNSYDGALKAWTELLAPHVNEGDASRIIILSEAAVSEESPEYGLVQKWLSQGKVLHGVGDMVSSVFSLKANITIQARYCSETGDLSQKAAQNAFWYPDDLTIKFCYELGASYLRDAIAIVEDKRMKQDWLP